MKIKFPIILCLSAILIFPSCDKFLDVAPESSATTGNAFKTASDIEAALTGAYNTFYTDYYVWDFFLLSDVRSDNAYAGGDDQEIFQYDNLNISPLNSRVFLDWRQLYNGIARANLVIGKISDVTDPQLELNNRREQIIAEAKFIRSYNYFELVKLFGGVPLVTEFGKVDPSEANKPRATEKEVYEFIISDLEDALILPETYGNSSLDKSRVTKGAVNALLAKVYAQKPDRDYHKVLEFCKAVESAGYALHPNYDELFDGSNYVNSEAILEIQYKASTPQSNWGPQMLLPFSLSGDDWRKYSTPSKDLIRAFDSEGDQIRKNSTVIFEEANWADEYWKPCAERGSLPFVFKWRHAEGWASGDYVYLLRFADILLLKAEALNETGDLEGAVTALNLVRDRVDLPEVTLGSKEKLRDLILKERRLELAFEGQRWSDLIRYNQIANVMDNLNEVILTCGDGSPTPVNYNFKIEKVLLPIPQNELNRNDKLEQNLGY